MDNLEFQTAGFSLFKIKNIIEKVKTIILDLTTRNAFTYNIRKIKVILFFKTYNQKNGKATIYY